MDARFGPDPGGDLARAGALRDNTAASLATAEKRLPGAAHPEALVAMAINGAVVPKTAIPVMTLQVLRPSVVRRRRY